MNSSALHPPKEAFYVESSLEGRAGVVFYCPTCLHWLWKWFGEELTPKQGEVSAGWHSRCWLINSDNPLRCNNTHDLIPRGPAPQTLLDWLDAGEPDWPMCPADFSVEVK